MKKTHPRTSYVPAECQVGLKSMQFALQDTKRLLLDAK
jgi:hypothetical protein